jgi:DNA-binding transcriptional LysR family regulator
MWETVELRELRVFLTLAEELHFGHSAERLGLTSSRVSQSLRKLEAKVGAQLVHRTSRHVELTASGERFRDEVGDLHRQLMAVLERTYGERRELSGTVRLGLLTPVIEGTHLPAISGAFQRRHPECRVEVSRAPYGDAFDCLRRGELDLLISWLPHGQSDLVVGPTLAREPRVLAVAQDHPLAGRSEVSLEDIADYKVLPQEEVMPRDMADAWIPRKTPTGRTIHRLRVPFGQMARRDASTLRQQMSWWIATGEVIYASVAPVEAILGSGIAYVPITDMPPLRSVLVWLRGSRDLRSREFVRVAKETLNAERNGGRTA